MDSIRIAAVVGMPLLGGILLAACAFAVPLRRLDARVLGYGLLLGSLLATINLRVLDWLGRPFAVMDFLLLSLLFCAVAAFVHRRMPVQVARAQSIAGPTGAARDWVTTLIGLLLLLLIVARLLLLGQEVLLRPLFGFDALMHWATKSRVWFAEGELYPFVSNQEWIQLDGKGVRTDHHPGYPPTVPLLQVWFALALGHWSEITVNLPWWIAGTALVLLFFGQGRAAGVGTTTTLIFSYLLVSLPLLDTHIALAGYADLILGVCYCGSLLALYSWQHERRPGQAILAIVLALMATQTKNEGFFWALTLLPAVLVILLPTRLALALLATGTAASLLVLALIPRDLVVAGHSLESLRIAYVPGTLSGLAAQFFQLATWHLLGMLLLLVPLGVWFAGARRESFLSMTVALLSAVVLYLFLFTMTKFSFGALHFTASGRIALHLVPAFLFLAMLVWHAVRQRWDPLSRTPDAEHASESPSVTSA